MASFNSTVITTKGHALIAKIVAGTATPTFTQMKVSNTDYSAYTQAQKEAMTSISNVKQSMQIAEVVKVNTASVKVSAALDNSALATGYYLKTIGLYAMDPVEGEILYSVTTAIESDWIPPNTGISITSIMIDLITVVSNADNVSVIVDPNATATVSQINEIWDEIDQPEFNSVQLTALEQIKSVIDSYGGIAEFIASGETLQQIITNGNFANGSTGWTGNLATISESAGILSSTSTSANGGAQQTNIKLRPGKYLVCANVKSSVASKVYIQLENASSPYQSFGVSDYHPGGSVWANLRFIADVTIEISTGAIRLRDLRTSGWDTIQIDDVMLIPLINTPYAAETSASNVYARIRKYFEGLQGAKDLGVGSRGKNLFNKNNRVLSKTIFGDGSTLGDSTLTDTSAYIKVKPNTNYTISNHSTDGSRTLGLYDKNFNIITPYTQTGNKTFLTPSNCAYVRFSMSKLQVDTAMFNEGTTALPYEEYQGSKATIICTDSTKFSRSKLPNLVENKFQLKDGKFQAIKNVAEQTLVSGDITALVTTAVNFDYARVTRKADNAAYNLTSQLSNSMISSFGVSKSWSTFDSIDNLNFIIGESGTLDAYTFPKGTYADLTAVRTALVGTKVQYPLATPITIPEDAFDDYGITVEGSLSSNTDFTEFFVEDYDLFTPITVNYSTNLAKATENLKESVQDLIQNKAIHSSGSNANGRWIRFNDGTQMCHNDNVAITVDPAAFIGTATSVDSAKFKIGRWK